MNNSYKFMPALAAGLAALFLAGGIFAADLRFIDVEREDDIYRLKSITWFAAEPEALYNLLKDYEQFSKFTSAVVESRNLEPDEDGRPQYFTRMEGCVLLWCNSFVRVGHLTLQPTSEIVANAHPEKSDFIRSRERWQLIPDGDGTLLVYEFEMVPDFWVPPVLGPFYIKRALKSGGEKAADRIEALALGREPQK